MPKWAPNFCFFWYLFEGLILCCPMSELQASAIELRESQWQDFKCLKFFSICITRPVFECDSWSLFHLLAWQNHQSIPHNSARFLQIGLFWQRMGNRDVASSNLSIYLHTRINLHIHRDPHLIFNTIFYMHVWKYTYVRMCVYDFVSLPPLPSLLLRNGERWAVPLPRAAPQSCDGKSPPRSSAISYRQHRQVQIVKMSGHDHTCHIYIDISYL